MTEKSRSLGRIGSFSLRRAYEVTVRLRLFERTASTARRILTILGAILHGAPDSQSGARPNPGNTMDRRELLLAVLAAGNGRPFSPVQIQKAMFLIDKNLPHLIHRGAHYNFEAYNYGPFDRTVYVEAESLRDEGRAIIAPSDTGRWNTYAASRKGLREGQESLERLKKKSHRYIVSVVDWVLEQSFGSLVKAIYDEYPDMKENSIFQG
jgi:hypothetical protein